jgi:hypothetical protein
MKTGVLFFPGALDAFPDGSDGFSRADNALLSPAVAYT